MTGQSDAEFAQFVRTARTIDSVNQAEALGNPEVLVSNRLRKAYDDLQRLTIGRNWAIWEVEATLAICLGFQVPDWPQTGTLLERRERFVAHFTPLVLQAMKEKIN